MGDIYLQEEVFDYYNCTSITIILATVLRFLLNLVMPLIEDPVHEYFTNHLDNLMVKHIYIFTLISIFMPIWVRFIVFEKEYFCSSGRRIKCKWDVVVGNMCFTIVKRIVGMLSKQKKRYSKFLFSTGFF